VIDIETALLQQFLNIAQRKRIAKIPPDRTKYESGFGLPPFEDRGSGSHFEILSRHQPAALKVATHPLKSFKPFSMEEPLIARTKLGTCRRWHDTSIVLIDPSRNDCR
jgi:hypothetical protein